MAKTSLSITSLFSSAWKIVTGNVTSIMILFGVVIVAAVAQMVIGRLGLPMMLEQILTWIVSTVAMVVYTIGGLQLVRGQSKLDLAQAWADPKLLLNVFIVNFILGIVIGVGFLLLIIPGIYLALTYGMASVVTIDEKLGPIASIKRSASLTQGNKMFIFVFGLAAAVINLVGALFLVVGLLVTIPLTGLAGLLLYEGLRTGSKTSL